MSDGQKIKRKCSMRYGSNKINRAGIDLKNFIYNIWRAKSRHLKMDNFCIIKRLE